MYTQQIQQTEPLFLLLLFFIAALAVLAKRVQIPYPIVLVIGGLVLSQIPHVPHLRLDPNVVFFVILPPLIFSGAFLTPWRDFRLNLPTISLLAFGLVIFTVVGVAAATRYFLSGFDWKTGLVLGAVVSATDPVAAISTARRLGLPKRITDLLEGESLVNDATGLLAVGLATAAVVSGRTPAVGDEVVRFLYLVFGSVAIGLAIGKAMDEIEARIADAPVEITLSVMAAYFAYLGAEGLHASGVMATVACGLYLGHRSSAYFSIDARLQAAAVWDTFTFVLNGIVFILIGLQLPYILEGTGGFSARELLALGLLFSAIVVALRLLWMYPAAWTSNRIADRLGTSHPFPDQRYVFIAGWTGMRGVLALAAAFALPEVLRSGAPFPQRNMILFLAFSVIFVTLVAQGLTLPALIRRLGLAGISSTDPEEAHARRAMAKAAIEYLEHSREQDRPEFAPIHDEMIRVQRGRLGMLEPEPRDEKIPAPDNFQRIRFLTQETRAIQRTTLMRLHRENKINDEVLRRLEHELDLLEARFPVSSHL